MAGERDASFRVYQNIGLDASELVADKTAAFQAYENLGLNPAELVVDQKAEFQVYDNLGLSPGELIADRNAEFQVYDNLGLGVVDFRRALITQRPLGWGVSPTKYRVENLLYDDEATFRVYQNITDVPELLADHPDLLLLMDDATNSNVALDSSGNNRHFNVIGPPGGLWQNPSLLGSGNGKSLVTDASLSQFLQLTSAAWMNSQSITCTTRWKCQAGKSMFIGRWTSGLQRPWLLTLSPSGIVVQLDNSGALINYTPPGGFLDGVVYTVTLRTDGSTAKIYLNGAEVASYNTTSPSMTLGTFEIGRAAASANSGGNIDTVAFWASALSPSRIAAHHVNLST